MDSLYMVGAWCLNMKCLTNDVHRLMPCMTECLIFYCCLQWFWGDHTHAYAFWQRWVWLEAWSDIELVQYTVILRRPHSHVVCGNAGYDLHNSHSIKTIPWFSTFTWYFLRKFRHSQLKFPCGKRNDRGRVRLAIEMDTGEKHAIRLRERAEI